MRQVSRSMFGARPKLSPRLHPLAYGVAAALSVMAHASCSAAPLPTGMQVVAGQAVANQSAGTLNIQTGQRTVLNWNSFSIGAGNQVVFQQPDASSAVLNRVVGQDPSSILGELRSNGQVWLINPNGVLFGAGARVDVAALVASTLDIDNRSFLAGSGLLTAAPGSSAAVVNQGTIQTPYGGQVLLVGASVGNSGVIDAPGGRVSLLAANQVQLADSTTPFMSFQVPSLAGVASQQGSVAAGEVDIYGAVVNQQGMVVATGTSQDAAGHIVLSSAGDTTLASGSLTQAQGGSVDIASSQGAVNVAGSVDASAAVTGNGGSISVDAVSIGVDQGASLRADAAGVGNGGHIALRAGDSISVQGALSARGGATSGDGGLIETSANLALNLLTAPDASAANGKPGQWLIDPYDVSIVSGSGTATNLGSGPSYTASASGATIDPSVIESALNAGTNVTISTGGASPGTDRGDINVSSPISVITPASGATLTLDAWNNINLGSPISASGGGPLNLNLNANQKGGAGTSSLLGSPASVDLNGGTLDLGANLVLGGGSLQNMTISSTTGAALISPSYTSSTLSRVTLQGANLEFPQPYSSVTVPDTLTVDSGTTVSITGYSTGLYFSGASSQLLGSGVVTLGGNFNDIVGISQSGATLTIGPGMTINAPGSSSSNFTSYIGAGASGVQLINQGTIAATGPGQLELDGSFINQGRLEADGAGVINTLGAFTSAAGAVVAGTGTINLAGGVLTNQGTIVAGASDGTAGTLTINGSLSEAPTATLQLNLGGVTAGSGYSVLNVSGSVALGGTLSVSQANGFTPVAGDAFTYLTFGSSSGSFATSTFNTPTDSWQLSSVASATSLGLLSAGVLTTPPPAPAPAPSPAPSPAPAPTPAPTGSSSSTGSSSTTTTSSSTSPALDPASAATTLQSVLSFAQVLPSNGGAVATSAISPAGSPTSASAAATSTSQQAGLTGASSSGLSGVSSSIVNFVPSYTAAAAGVAEQTGNAVGTVAANLHSAQMPQYLYLNSDLSNLYFRVLPLQSMGRGEIGDVLGARSAYMHDLFARANDELAADPGLANVPDCKPGQDPAGGTCLYVPPLHPPADDGSRVAHALVVGMADYSDPRIPRLIGTLPDATSVHGLLHSDLGYRAQLLPNPSKRQLIAALNELIAHAGSNDSLLIYYAGHGDTVESTGQGYWIPTDANPDNPRGWVSNVDIDRLLQRARSRQIAVVSDSCYSGHFVQDSDVMKLAKVLPIDTLLRRRAVTVMSSGSDEPVADTGADGHSVFASDLMRSLASIQGWRNGAGVFQEVRQGVESMLPQSPRYGAVLSAGHEPGADYVFERSSVQEAAR